MDPLWAWGQNDPVKKYAAHLQREASRLRVLSAAAGRAQTGLPRTGLMWARQASVTAGRGHVLQARKSNVVLAQTSQVYARTPMLALTFEELWAWKDRVASAQMAAGPRPRTASAARTVLSAQPDQWAWMCLPMQLRTPA